MEKPKKFLFCALFVFIFHVEFTRANDFPSLLVANATMAVIVDHEYLGEEYEPTLALLKSLLEQTMREDLKDGGLNLKFFSWSKINFNKDFTAVLSVANCKNSWETFYSVRKETLLLIAFTDADCPRFPVDEAIMIPIIEVGQELPQILLDIRTRRAINWRTATVIYDSIFDRDTISRVANALSLENAASAMSISLLRLNISTEVTERKESFRQALRSFPQRYVGKNYMVIATMPSTVLEIANELSLIDSTSQWMFLISNMHGKKSNSSLLLSSIPEGGNVAIASNHTVSDDGCAKGKKCIFHELLRNFMMALSKMTREEEAIYGQISDEEWEAIRLTKRERRDDMLSFIKERLNESPMCQSCISWTFEAAETWGLRFSNEEGNNVKNFKPKITKAAEWRPTNGLIIFDSLFPHIEFGFRGRKVPVATFHNPPWQVLTFSESGEVLEMQGIVVHILNELAKKLNFTYVVQTIDKLANRTTYSYMDDFNNTSDDEIKPTLNMPIDVLEMLSENRVFFGAAATTVSQLFEKEVNFTYPISVQSYSMLTSRPRELSRLYLFTAPFTLDTWLCLSFTIAVIGPLLYCINFLSPYYGYIQLIKRGGLFKVGNCFWYVYGALLQQGGMYLPRADSGRIIVGTWWLVVLVVVTTYCGNLVAFLTFPKMESPVSSVHELVNNRNGFSWGIRESTFLQKYLQETEIEKYVQLNTTKQLHERASADVVQKVRGGKHIYIDWKANLLHIMRREYLETGRCDFSISPEEFVDEKIALTLPANSPYLSIINAEIYRMLQMGFIHKWLGSYLPKKDRCSMSSKKMEIENHTVNLADMQGCFLVLIAGVIASIIIILFECIFHRYKICSPNKLVVPFSK